MDKQLSNNHGAINYGGGSNGRGCGVSMQFVTQQRNAQHRATTILLDEMVEMHSLKTVFPNTNMKAEPNRISGLPYSTTHTSGGNDGCHRFASHDPVTNINRNADLYSHIEQAKKLRGGILQVRPGKADQVKPGEVKSWGWIAEEGRELLLDFSRSFPAHNPEDCDHRFAEVAKAVGEAGKPHPGFTGIREFFTAHSITARADLIILKERINEQT